MILQGEISKEVALTAGAYRAFADLTMNIGERSHQVKYLKEEITHARDRRSPARILETGIGFYIHGGFTKLCLDNLWGEDLLDTVEYEREHINEYLKEFGESNNVKIHHSDSLEFIRNAQHRYDLAFLDSANDSEHVFNEFMSVTSKMQDDGVILVDDAGVAGGDVVFRRPDNGKLIHRWPAVKKSKKGLLVHKYCIDNNIKYSVPCSNVLSVKMLDIQKKG